MPDDGIVSLADAFASAESELGVAAPGDAEPSLPEEEAEDASAANKAEGGATDSPDEEQGTEDPSTELEGWDELFGLPDNESSGIDTSSPEFLATTVTLNTVEGPETLTIEELRDGYMRRADYTQKTQAVAAQRRVVEDAVEFFQSFQDNPAEFARTLATRAGLISEGAEPVKDIEVAKIPTAEAVEQMVEERLQERLKDDPSVKQARLAAAREQIRTVFEGIEESHGVSLSKEQRQAVITEANKRGTTDLALVFDAMMGRLRSQQSRRAAAPARSKSAAAPVEVEQGSQPKVPQTVEEAFKFAEAELAGA